jgi:flagellar L-ring protein FlgH
MMVRRAFLTALVVLAGTSAAAGQNQKKNDNYDEVFEAYLTTARTLPAASAPTPWMATLFSDLRARNVNDLVTVQVIENINASGSADAALDKNSNGNIGVRSIFGSDAKFADWFDPTALARWSASTEFQGSGATTRSGALSAVVTARVTEVLPNGDLVLEGVREIEINGDRQIVVLTGVVRPSDISRGNVVPSTAVGQMRIRYFGRGLIKDNLTPGWLVRIFNKIF